MKRTNCHIHGEQGIGLVCSHIAEAIERVEKVGFHWGEEGEGLSRPDAWCADCEKKRTVLNKVAPGRWFIKANFKMLCATCWDEAKAACGGLSE